MAGAELQEHLVQQAVDLPAAQTDDALDDAADPRLPAGIEEAGNDAANIAGEGDRQTPDVQRARAAFAVAWIEVRIVTGGIAQDVLRCVQRSCLIAAFACRRNVKPAIQHMPALLLRVLGAGHAPR